MAKRCGPKAFAKRIKAGDFEIPVRGWEPVMFMVFNMKLDEDEEIFRKITEREFNNALLKEYKAFSQKIKANRELRIE
jgi:hypothetical protein